MKLEKLSEGLQAVMERFDIDATTVLLLNEIVVMGKAKGGEVTIMEVIRNSKIASSATLHARIKKLVARKLLLKVQDEGNQRFKMLTTGPKYDEFVQILAEV